MSAHGREACERCSAMAIAHGAPVVRVRRGDPQPEDGDASRLFEVAAHRVGQGCVVLCKSCVAVLEAMALRASGVLGGRVPS